MIVPDVNVLIHAMNSDSEHHALAWTWWNSALGGHERIGLTWPVITAYVRISSNPRIMPNPIAPAEAISDVRTWLDSRNVDVLTPGPDHLHVLDQMLDDAGRGGDFVTDAHLAAIAFEHGGTVYSQDADFARFTQVRWIDPLRG